MKPRMETTIKAPDFSVIKKEHINKWVALSPDYKSLLAVGESLSDVVKKTSKFKEKTVMKVLPNLGYAPTSE